MPRMSREELEEGHNELRRRKMEKADDISRQREKINNSLLHILKARQNIHSLFMSETENSNLIRTAKLAEVAIDNAYFIMTGLERDI